MGNTESYVVINLDSKDGTYKEYSGYFRIKYKRETYNDKFIKLTATITHDVSFRFPYYKYFTVYICELTGFDYRFSASPERSGDAVQKVEAYFSTLHPERPLILGFKVNNRSDMQYYTYSHLLKYKSFYGMMDGKFEKNKLSQKLDEENKNINKPLTFRYGNNFNKNVKRIPRMYSKDVITIESSPKFKKVTFVSSLYDADDGDEKGPWELYSDRLFILDGKVAKYMIPRSCLSHFIDRMYHNVCVYYPIRKDEPLLVEFIEDFDKKAYLMRKDKHGKCWKSEEIGYKDDTQLTQKLEEILSQIQSVTNTECKKNIIPETKLEDLRISTVNNLKNRDLPKKKPEILHEKQQKPSSFTGSYIYIDLDAKDETEQEKGGYYKIRYTKNSDGLCKYYEKLTVEITYNVGYKLGYYNYFNIYISEKHGSGPTIKYHPESHHDIFDKIESYFSIFHPQRPLILGFRIQTYDYSQYYEYAKLKGRSFTRPPDDEFHDTEITDKLNQEDKRINKQLVLKSGEGEKSNIKEIPHSSEGPKFIGTSRRYKKITYLPNSDNKSGGSDTGPWEIYEKSIFKVFAIDGKNTIDTSAKRLIGKQWTSIISYYDIRDEMPLVVKLIYGCIEKCLVRQDTEGKKWKEETDKSKDDHQMEQKLREVEDKIYNKPTTYHLEKKEGRYGNILVRKKGDTGNYSEYDHSPIIERVDKGSVVLIKKKKFSTNNGQVYDKPLFGVGAYFLKDNGIEDEEPILIGLKERKGDGYANLTYYYNRNEKWTKLDNWPNTLDQQSEIIDKVQKSYQEGPFTEMSEFMRYTSSETDDRSSAFSDTQSQYQTTNESKTSVADIAGGSVGGVAAAGLSGGGFFLYRHFDSVRFKI